MRAWCWGPLPEGKVRSRVGLAFLCLAAWDGFWNPKGGRFMRFMFGRVVDLAASRGTRWHLAIAGLVVLALGVLNATATALFASTIVENEDGPGPYGAKGVGEGSLAGAAAAVVTALADLGVTITELPVTPERVWRAMQRCARA